MELKVSLRDIKWKKVNQLRRQGYIPATIYGRHLEKPISICCARNEFVKLFKEAWHSTPVTLKWEWIEEMVLIHDYQLDPVMDTVLHVDFLGIKKWEKVSAEVSIVMQWEELSPIVKLGEGTINLVKDYLAIEALPKDLLKEITVDVSGIDSIDTTIFVKDLNLPEGVVAKDDPEQAIVTVMQAKEESVEEEWNDNPAWTAWADAEAEAEKAAE